MSANALKKVKVQKTEGRGGSFTITLIGLSCYKVSSLLLDDSRESSGF